MDGKPLRMRPGDIIRVGGFDIEVTGTRPQTFRVASRWGNSPWFNVIEGSPRVIELKEKSA